MASERDDAEFEDTAGEGLPWLEPAELEYEEEGGFLTRRTLIVGALAVMLVVALLWAIAEYWGGEGITIPEGDNVPLVKAPAGPYKVEPDDRGGMDLPEGELATHAVAEGEQLAGEVAVDALPEDPVPVVPPVGTGEAESAPVSTLPDAQRAEREVPLDETIEPEPREARPDSAASASAETAPTGDAAVQLGAFSSRGRADEVWSTLSERYSYLGDLAKSVESVEVGGKTLYRLRASGLQGRAAAADMCARLKAAGEQCVVP